MAEFTGVVVNSDAGYRFQNDDGNLQRLTKAKLDEDKKEKEIDLKPYADQFLRVRGEWEHDWIIEAEILDHQPRGSRSTST